LISEGVRGIRGVTELQLGSQQQADEYDCVGFRFVINP